MISGCCVVVADMTNETSPFYRVMENKETDLNGIIQICLFLLLHLFI